MVLFDEPWYPETKREMSLRYLGEDIFGGIVCILIIVFIALVMGG
jgi:hypothetical protein